VLESHAVEHTAVREALRGWVLEETGSPRYRPLGSEGRVLAARESGEIQVLAAGGNAPVSEVAQVPVAQGQRPAQEEPRVAQATPAPATDVSKDRAEAEEKPKAPKAETARKEASRTPNEDGRTSNKAAAEPDRKKHAAESAVAVAEEGQTERVRQDIPLVEPIPKDGLLGGLKKRLKGREKRKEASAVRDARMHRIAIEPQPTPEGRKTVVSGADSLLQYTFREHDISVEALSRSRKAFNFAYNARKRATDLKTKSVEEYDALMFIIKVPSDKIREKFNTKGGDYFGKNDFLDVMSECVEESGIKENIPRIASVFEGLFQDYNINISQALDSLRIARQQNPNATSVLLYEARIRDEINQDSLALDLFERSRAHVNFDDLLDSDIYNLDSLIQDNVRFYRIYYKNPEFIPYLSSDRFVKMTNYDRIKAHDELKRKYVVDGFMTTVKEIQASPYKVTDPRPFFDFLELFFAENDSVGAATFLTELNHELGGRGGRNRGNYGDNDPWPKLVTNYLDAKIGYLRTKPGGWRGTSVKVVSDIGSDMYADGKIKIKFFKKSGEQSNFSDYDVNIRQLGRGDNSVGSYMSLYYPYKTDYIDLDSTYVINLPTGDFGYDIAIDFERFKVIKQRMPFQLVIKGGNETSHRVTADLEFVVGGTEVREKLPPSDRINITSKGELEYSPLLKKKNEDGAEVIYTDGDMKPYELKSGRVGGRFMVEVNTSTRNKNIELTLAEISNRSSINNDARRMALSTMAMLAAVVVVAP
jgi:hypothetical protein